MCMTGASFLTYKLVGDFAPGYVAQYSTRRLRMGYTGPAMVVRRDSDNQQTFVYYDSNGELSPNSKIADGVTSFSTWYGGANVYVDTWQDQSGFANDAFQNTTTAQPRIVDLGTLETWNGRATVTFNGSQFLTANDSASLDIDAFMTAIVVVYFSDLTTVRSIFDKRTNNSPIFTGYHFYQNSTTNLDLQWNGSSNVIAQVANAITTGVMYSLSFEASKTGSATFWNKNSGLGTATLSSIGSSVNADPLRLGGHVNSPSLYLQGKMSELILYSSVIDTTARTNIVTNQTNWFVL